jgi:sugar transferase (PEP-CTERM system associated)
MFSETGGLMLEQPLWQMISFAFVLSCCSLAMGVYTSVFREGKTGMVLRTVVSYFFLGTGSLTVIYYVFPDLYLGRGVLAFAVTIALVLILLLRLAFFKLTDRRQLTRNVVILGAGTTAAQVVDCIRPFRNELGFRIIGCVPSGKCPVQVENVPVLEEPEDWWTFVKTNDISEIIVAPDERRTSEGGNLPISELLDCKLKGIRVTEPLAFLERELLRIEVSMMRPVWALFSEGFVYSQVRDLIKRLFDILLASLLLFLAWPVMLLTALAVYLESGSPVLYKQVRVGLYGRQFTINKFRSMVQNAEKDGKAVWATKNDARVTRVGAFIRNTRLDELPQLYNVLRGDMSFIGPRPERPQFVSELNEQVPFYDARHRVKPGLMGWAQLKYPYGASVADAENKLKYDLYYVKNHSFFLDVLIVIQTVEVVLLGKGVH